MKKLKDSVFKNLKYSNDFLFERREKERLLTEYSKTKNNFNITTTHVSKNNSQLPYIETYYTITTSPSTQKAYSTARNKDNLLVGVLFGLTDFAYWLYITDLGVDRVYQGQGIGSSLVKEAHKIAGGEKNIAIYLVANDGAIPFYQKLGMKKSNEVMEYNHVDWTPFKVE